jgi:hypothetical protein
MSDAVTKPERGSGPSTPRWVKVFGIIFIVLIVLFVILHLTGNSFGFGEHMATMQNWLRQLWP